MPVIVDGPLKMVNTLTIAPERREEYLSALAEILPQARAQSTCVYLEVGEVVGRPGTFVLNELWRDGRVFVAEILSLPFYQRYIERCEPLYAAPRTVLVLEPIDGIGGWT
jgi:quinol monooxygenase YgiN